MSQPNEPDRRHVTSRLKRAGLVALGVAVLIVANGVRVRLQAQDEQQTLSTLEAVPNVSVVHPEGAKDDATLTLPGNLQAFYSARIYPRVPGYVRRWYKDIGAPVHRGDLLAEIDTPELDQQIDQAQADLASAEAAQVLSKTTATRWTNLLKVDAVSKQEADEKTGDLAAKTALVNAAKANVIRLQSMKSFARITAPFDGVVTERNTDIGALVNAGAGSSGSALFMVSDMRKIRVYVRVPQNYSAEISAPMMADVTLPEYPGETFSAKLVSTSNAISDQSNTLLVQLEAPNDKGKLKPGEYAQVSFRLPPGDGRLSIPVSALMFRGDGLQVASVTDGSHVTMKPIEIARDLGARVEISSGLGAGDNVIDNPPDSLNTGDTVHVVAAAQATAQRAEGQ